MRWNTQQKLKSVVVLFICLLLTTLLAGCSNNASSQGNAQTARPTQTISTTQSIVITAIDYTYSMPTTLTLHAGLVDLTLINNGTQPHQAQFARLNPGVIRDQIVEQLITKRDQAAAFSLLTFVGGPDTISAGDGQETILNLEPGEYVLLCLVTGSDGLPHIDKGMIHFLTVATSQSQEALPKADGEIVIHNHDYVLPESLLQARPLTLQVQNQGTEPHELNIVRLNAGKNLQDILSFFRAPSGRPPFEEFGGMATLAAESSGWLKLDLEPGNYAVLSAIPDPHTGVFQLVQGLLAAFTVY